MTKNWRIIREGVQHRSLSSMINEIQVGEILSRRQRNESISHIARTMNLSRPTVGDTQTCLRNKHSRQERARSSTDAAFWTNIEIK